MGNADIWALGVILFECSTGRHPFRGDQADESNLFFNLNAIMNKSIPALPGTYSKDFHDFVNICLDRDPHTRPHEGALLQHPWLRHANCIDLGGYASAWAS